MSMSLALTTTAYDAAQTEWLASAHKVHLTGGVTIDADAVTAVGGKKIVKAGTAIGKNGSTGLWEPYTAAVANSLTTGVVGDNNAIKWTAVSGAPKVALVDPSGNDKALSLSVDWGAKEIAVSLATSGAGAITSTAADVIAAIQKDYVASQLVTVANATGSDGTGAVAAKAKTALSGGTAQNVTPSALIFHTVDVTDGDKAAGALIHGVVLEARLPVAPDAVVKAALKDIQFI